MATRNVRTGVAAEPGPALWFFAWATPGVSSEALDQQGTCGIGNV